MIAWAPATDDADALAGPHPRISESVSEMPATRLPMIGHPLGHGALEAILSTALDEAGAGLTIERWERRPHQLADALDEIRADDAFAGALIASPHKERAPSHADALSEDARLRGAVNVFLRLDGRMRGHNTDADGIRAGLAAILPRVKGKWPRNAVVLGAGGGARADVAVLIAGGFQHVAVLNRHLHRAEALVAHFSRTARHMELRARPWHDAIIETELERAELLVNASGIGVDEGASPIPIELLPPDRYVRSPAYLWHCTNGRGEYEQHAAKFGLTLDADFHTQGHDRVRGWLKG